VVTLLDIIILAIIQGVTEWLPISSSGHLVIFQELRSIQVPIGFDISLHLGSIFALIIYFRQNIVARIRQRNLRFSSQQSKQYLCYLVLSGISTGIVVFALNDVIRLVFTNLRAVGLGLLVTALFLGVSNWKAGTRDLSKKHAVLIGMAQGIAAIPGISRSGMTFSIGLLSDIRRDRVFRYSLLLSVPTIIGATIFESRNLSPTMHGFEVVILGIAVTTIVGYYALCWLKTIYDKQSGLIIFVPYCAILGVLLIAFSQ
jgi:undecaprenyl-diphosphatase